MEHFRKIPDINLKIFTPKSKSIELILTNNKLLTSATTTAKIIIPELTLLNYSQLYNYSKKYNHKISEVLISVPCTQQVADVIGRQLLDGKTSSIESEDIKDLVHYHRICDYLGLST